jgi:hypothetical protein
MRPCAIAGQGLVDCDAVLVGVRHSYCWEWLVLGCRAQIRFDRKGKRDFLLSRLFPSFLFTCVDSITGPNAKDQLRAV